MNKKIISTLILGLFIVSTTVFASETDSSIREKYEQKNTFKKDVYNKTLKFINQNPNSPGLAKLYFNIAEMSTEIDVNYPAKIASYYKHVLEKDPNFPEKDYVLYKYGYYYFQAQLDLRNEQRQANMDLVINWPDYLRINEKKLQPAIDAYKTILTDFPESDYNSESLYRLGNIYFEIALDSEQPREYFEIALEYFDQLAQREGDPKQYYGIFHKAWTYFASGRFEESIYEFTKILKIIQENPDSGFDIFFKDDAIDNIAFSLIEYDGIDFESYSVASQKAIEIFNAYNPEFAKNIIKKSIELKKMYNAPMQMIDFYNSFISLFPNDIETPMIVDSIITVFKRNPSRVREKTAVEKIFEQYVRLTTEFGGNSSWYEINKPNLNNDSPQIILIRKAYEQFVEPRYLNNFVRNKRYDDYLTYRNLTFGYSALNDIADSTMTVKMKQMQFNVVAMSQEIADTFQKPYDYFVAINDIKEFDKTYVEYPEKTDLKEFEYNDYEQIYNILQDSVKVAPYEIAEMNLKIDEAILDSIYVQASKAYQKYLETYNIQNIDAIVKLVYKRAELYFSKELYDDASLEFNYLLDFIERESTYSNNNLQEIAFNKLAIISNQKGDYKAAEAYYRKANLIASEENKAIYQNNILANMQYQANTLAETANYLDAANEYLRMSVELKNTDSEKSLGFKTKAIENFKAAGEYQKAIDLLLEIAVDKQDKEDKLAVFVNAWTITDSLKDYSQSELLRNMFINQYPNSNEAYRAKVQIIDFYENEPYHDKLKAAEMYMELHDAAVNGNLDIGDVNPSSLYLKAIALSKDIEEQKMVELLLDFERKYPNHEKANEFLIEVAKIYKKNGETDKFETLARNIYKKDPSINILQDIAIDKLNAQKDLIVNYFNEKRFDEMFVEIDKFKELDDSFKADGLNLDLSSIYEQFSYFKSYVEYYVKFDKKILSIKENFINAPLNSLVRVNENTTWGKHLIKGKKRIAKLEQRAEKLDKELIDLIKEGNEKYQLPIERKTEALYLIVEVYEFSANVINTQINKYLSESNEINVKYAANLGLQKKIIKSVEIARNKEIAKLLGQAKKRCKQLYDTFAKDKDYSDVYTDLAYQKLVDWGIESPKIYVDYYTDMNWKMQNENVSDSLLTIEWVSAQLDSNFVLLDSAEVISLPALDKNVVKFTFDLEYLPEVYFIDYVSDFPANIYVNQQMIDKKHQEGELIDFADRKLQEYSLANGGMLNVGLNEIMFEIPGNPQNETDFAAHIRLQYDEAKLEFEKTTEKGEIVTDYDWKVIPKNNLSIDEIYASLNIASTDSVRTSELEWVQAGDAKLQIYKAQIFGMEETQAIPIWHPKLDTTDVKTMVFYKEIDGELISAELKFLAQQKCSIWFNNKLVIQDDEYTFDTSLLKAISQEIKLNEFNPERNILMIEVTGSEKYKGLILEMDYIKRKK